MDKLIMYPNDPIINKVLRPMRSINQRPTNVNTKFIKPKEIELNKELFFAKPASSKILGA